MTRYIAAPKGFQIRLGGMGLLLALPILAVGALLLVLAASLFFALLAAAAVVGAGVCLWLKLTRRSPAKAVPPPARTIDVVDVKEVDVIDIPAPKQLKP